MRPFPLAVAILTVAALLPGVAVANECTSNDPTHHVCVEQNVVLPVDTPPALYPAVSFVEQRYYVYVGIEECSTSPISRACTGAGEGPGMVSGTMGIVYQESNGYAGLQRHQFGTINGPRPADTMVLV